jgi:hypothetical protein
MVAADPGLEELLAIQSWVNCAIAKLASRTDDDHAFRAASNLAAIVPTASLNDRHPRKYSKHPLGRQYARGEERRGIKNYPHKAWHPRAKHDETFKPIDISRRLV